MHKILGSVLGLLVLCGVCAAQEVRIEAKVGELIVIESVSGSRLILTASQAGAFTFMEVASSPDGIVSRQHRITVTGGTVPPIGGPATPPPVSRYGLEAKVKAALLKVPEERRVDAAGLRLAYLTTVSRVDSKELKTPNEAMEHQRNATREFLGDNLSAWNEFGAAVSAALKELAESGKMKTVEDHRQALFEIATGLSQ